MLTAAGKNGMLGQTRTPNRELLRYNYQQHAAQRQQYQEDQPSKQKFRTARQNEWYPLAVLPTGGTAVLPTAVVPPYSPPVVPPYFSPENKSKLF